MKDFHGFSIIEFLDYITETEKKYEFVFSTLEEKMTVVGTKDELRDIALQIPYQQMRESVFKKIESYPDEPSFEYSQIDIANYLDEITKGFQPKLSKLTLLDIENYLQERVNDHFFTGDIIFTEKYLKSQIKNNPTAKKTIKSIEEIIDLNDLKEITEKLAVKLDGYKFFKTISNKVLFKSKDALFAFLITLEEKKMLLKLSLEDNRDEIGRLFLIHYDLNTQAKDPTQKLRKGQEIADSTKDFFADNM